MSNNNHRAVVLMSGGLDSSVTAALARSQGYQLYALTIAYGQRHRLELECAKTVAKHLEVREHLLLDVPLDRFGGSALTGQGRIPTGSQDREPGSDIPATYVPARNTIFLSLALGWAEALQALHIFIGVNAIDYSGYPDCRPEYIRAYQEMADLATRTGVQDRPIKIHTPLINLTKAEIIRTGVDLGLDLGLTLSCYQPTQQGRPCGECDSCRLRQQGFQAAGLEDPARPR